MATCICLHSLFLWVNASTWPREENHIIKKLLLYKWVVMVTVKNFLKTHFWSNEKLYEKFLIVRLVEITDNFEVCSILFLCNLMKTMCSRKPNIF